MPVINPLWERACSRRRRHRQNLRQPTHHFREQARSHMGSALNTECMPAIDPLWGRACSRRRRHRQNLRQPTHHFREQARSHRGSAL
ncbi:hypothetical protein FHG55_13375, partial [Pseudomonas jessenii]